MRYLTVNNSNKKALVDDEDYEKLRYHTWHIATSRIKTDINKVAVSIAQVIFGTKLMYDHKDRNIFNNQKDNLRVCTYSQNGANRAKWVKNSSSKYKGVFLDKKRNIWRASIKIKGKQISLGDFDTEEEAALKYNKVALKHFGEFAYLNVIEEDKE